MVGAEMERRTRQRTRVLASARAGTDAGPAGLASIVAGDESPYWKSSSLLLLDSLRYVNHSRAGGDGPDPARRSAGAFHGCPRA